MTFSMQYWHCYWLRSLSMSNCLLLSNAQVLNFNAYIIYQKYKNVCVAVAWLNMLVASVKICISCVELVSCYHCYVCHKK